MKAPFYLLLFIAQASFGQAINFQLAPAQYFSGNLNLNSNFRAFDFARADLGDLDGDGDLDVVLMGVRSGSVNVETVECEVYRNDGHGNFGSPSVVGLRGVRGDLELVDLDGDGDLDIFMSGRYESLRRVRIYLNDGTGQFTSFINSGIPNIEGSFDFGDVDGDGDLDFAILGTIDAPNLPNGYQNHTGLYINNGFGVFSGDTSAFTQLFYGDVAFIDSDSDGDLDIVSSGHITWGTPQFHAYINNGSNQFVANTSLTATPLKKAHFHVADLNGDAQDDFIYAGDSTLTLFSSTGAGGSFTSLTNLPLPKYDTPHFESGDVDSDGDLDLFISANEYPEKAGAYCFLNDGNNNFSERISLDFGRNNYTDDAVFGDVNGDGSIDVFFLNGYRGFKFCLNDGTGRFYEVTSSTFGVCDVSGADVGDINGDGNIDFVFTGLSSANERVFVSALNDGSGSFQLVRDTSVMENFRELKLADLDSDGDLDLAMVNMYYSSRSMVIYLNDGSGNFQEGWRLDSAGTYASMNIFDADGDGDLDVLAAGRLPDNTGKILYLINDGSGHFIENTSQIFTPVRISGMGNADLDNDGDVDILMGGFDPNNVLVSFKYTNDGSGQFTRVNTPFNRAYSPSYQLSDINADGFVDVVYSANLVPTSLYYNLGNGSFGAPIQLLTTTPWASVLPIDADRDGDLDLLTSSYQFNQPTSSAKLFEQNTSTNFIEFPNSGIQDVPTMMMFAEDFDNDSDDDILLIGLYDDVIQFYRNYPEGISIREHSTSEGHYSIYPNPVSNELYLSDLPANCTISIINAMGQVVLQQPSHDREKSIDVRHLTVGTYFVRVDCREAPSLTGKLIIIR